MKILLASQSPRRKELLKGLGYEFETLSLDVEEVYPEDLSAAEVADYLSQLKADSYEPMSEDTILITADTVVVSESEILGKPKTSDEAVAMLLSLSGKTHQVYTAVTVKTSEKSQTFTDVAQVEFDFISETEAKYYVQTYNPLDKAGAYGVQEWLGMAKIKNIKGSFYTIMGLPTHLLYKVLQDFF